MTRSIDLTAVTNWVRLKQQAGDPAAPAAGYWVAYVKAGGLYIEDESANIIGPFDAVETFTFGFHIPGTLTTGAKEVRLLAPYTGTITNVVASVNTAPTGANLVVDIHNGGTTIYTDQGKRISITAGANDDTSAVPDVTAVTQNDVFTLEIDVIGSTVAGADLNVQIRGTKA